jgi:hypothetical protein
MRKFIGFLILCITLSSCSWLSGVQVSGAGMRGNPYAGKAYPNSVILRQQHHNAFKGLRGKLYRRQADLRLKTGGK